MHGLMMDFPLTLPHLLERAAKLYPSKPIVWRAGDPSARYTYAHFHRRVHRLAHALASLGVKPGDRVATLCWNTQRHLEMYFAVPCLGAVLHTLNLRLGADQLAYIVNHAEDTVLVVDESLLPLLNEFRGNTPSLQTVIVAAETGTRPSAPDLDYDDLLAAQPEDPFPWPRLEENAAAATCYTSGTTGNPKGVVYSHRALFLHSFALCLADSFALSERDSVLQLVPMFHANGWGIPYAAVMTGAKLVLAGRGLQPESIASAIESERVTFTAGVPTLWMTLRAHLERHSADLSSLRMVVVAGSAMPRDLIEWYARANGVPFRLAWGMTETTPIATFVSPKSHLQSLPQKEWFDLLARHGMPVPGVEVRIVGPEGSALPWDAATMGELQVRGPWVTSGYYRDDRSEGSFQDGWFRTGDVATIDPEGYIQIMDRTKDLVKSGGEWIPSVDLENAIMAHPKVLEAAVIAVPHPKWQERPLACVVARPGAEDALTKAELLAHLASRVPKWWLPDDIVLIDAIPKTSVGKFNKRALRDQFRGYRLPSD